jgi:enterochelin esterase-like enzyme
MKAAAGRKAAFAAMAALALAGAPLAAQQAPRPMAPVFEGPQLVTVSLPQGVADSQSGRLILAARPVAAVNGAAAPSMVATGDPSWVAAAEVVSLRPNESRRVDIEAAGFPGALSTIPAGEYWVQVRLDTNHSAAYVETDPEHDFVSAPQRIRLPSAEPIRLTLESERAYLVRLAIARGQTEEAAARALTRPLPDTPAAAEMRTHLKEINFESPSLTAFWGRPMHIRGYVLLPPNYTTTTTRYPTVYRTEGFGGSMQTLPFTALSHYNLMKSGQTPPMIRVFLDHSSPWGTHEFADSANNGPWGKALTTELIPALERQYRMDARPSGRFVTGHSSGGWFAMWQIVRYPDVYGGAWARAPDPVDFRSFTGVDIYRDGANAFLRPDGSPQYLVRDQGAEVESLRDYALRENVIGDYGGQFDSFDWVFSPRADDGRAMPLFDRATGRIDPAVAAYWREHYDISAITRRDWRTLKPKLDGKIHLFIGDVDTFHLNEAAHLLQQEMNTLGARASFTFIPGGTHFNLDTQTVPGDQMGLEKKIAWEMYAIARPTSTLRPPAATPAPAASPTPRQ